MEYSCLKDVTETISICFDPNPENTLIDDDRVLMEEYNEFKKVMEDCGLEEEQGEYSKWVIRIEISKEEMMDRNITMDDIHFALKNSLKNSISCVFSDLNADKLVFRIRLENSKAMMNSNQKSLDQTDQIYMLKNLQDNILNNIILKGIKGIPKIIIRKVTNQLIKKDGNYVPDDIWVLDTVGKNLKEILANENINVNKTYSNDIQEVYHTLGIEAARKCILTELEEAFADTSYINYHHLSMLCDRMCATKKMVSVFRHGINNDDIGPIAKASFEETPEMFLRAARHAELDLMTGVSSNIMCGQEGYFGTGSFQVMLNVDEVSKMESKELEKKLDVNSLLEIEDDSEFCSKNNIKITDNSNLISGVDTGNIVDDYDMGF